MERHRRRSLRGQPSDAALSAQFSGSNNAVNSSASPVASQLGSSVGRSPSKRASFSLLSGGRSFEEKLFYRPTPRTNSMEQKVHPVGPKDDGAQEKEKGTEAADQKTPTPAQPSQPSAPVPSQPANENGEPVKLTKEQRKAAKAERKQNRLAEQGQSGTSGQQQQQQQKKGPPANLPEKKSLKDMTKAERREKQVMNMVDVP